MKNRIQLSIFSLFLLALVCIIFIRHSHNIENDDHGKFYYSPNDSHCPIPIFPEETLTEIILNDECQSEFPNWIYIFNNYVVFNETLFRELGGFKCFFKEIKWDGDFQSIEDRNWENLFNYTCLENRILHVVCKAKGLFNYNEQFLIGFDMKDDIAINDKFNILVVGIDSLSKLAWKKFLPESHSFMENQMHSSSVIFKKVNVRGDGTTINLLAMLTGEEETEVYESRKNEKNARHIDDYPWIWKNLSKAHYKTFYDEDDIEFGTFQYRLLGFKNQPTDHYGRMWRMIHKSKKRGKLCMNRKNYFQFQVDSIERFFKIVKSPKFALIFSSYFTHNANEYAINIDKDLLKLLKKIQDPNGMFNNTLVVLMSDHGHRFNSRYHLRGKYEERLPFLFVNVPRSMSMKYPHLVPNMRQNEHKLVTLYDVHETMLDLLGNFTSTNAVSYSKNRKISLFNSKMSHRNCTDVKIPVHWCVCLKWQEINTRSADVIGSANHAIHIINKHTEEYRAKCYQLKLDKMLRAYLVSPNDNVVTFLRSDRDGRKPDLSDNTFVDSVYYRVTFTTTPGDAIFEATVNVKRQTKVQYRVSINDIDRNNKYAKWVWCIDNTMRDVRKYCLCS